MENVICDTRKKISDEEVKFPNAPFQKTDVVIVGITTGGLLLSLDLTNKNVKNVLINKYENSEKSGKYETNYIPNLRDDETDEQFLLLPKTLEILQDLKLLSKISSKGIKLNGISFYVENKLVNSTDKQFLQNCNTTFPYMLSISKYTVNDILKNKLKSTGGIIKEDIFFWNVLHKYEQKQQNYVHGHGKQRKEKEKERKEKIEQESTKGAERGEEEKKREITGEQRELENKYNNRSQAYQTILKNEQQKKTFNQFSNFISDNNISFNPFCINNNCNIPRKMDTSKEKTLRNDYASKKIYTKPSLLKNREQKIANNSISSLENDISHLRNNNKSTKNNNNTTATTTNNNNNNSDELYYEYSSSSTNGKTTNDSIHSNTSGTLYSMSSSNSIATFSNYLSSDCSSILSTSSFLSSLNHFTNHKKTYEAVYNNKKKVAFSKNETTETIEQRKCMMQRENNSSYSSKQEENHKHASMVTLNSFPKLSEYCDETEKRKYIRLSADFSSNSNIPMSGKTTESQEELIENNKDDDNENGVDNCDGQYYTAVHVKQKVLTENETETIRHNMIKTKFIVGTEGRKSAVRKLAHINLEKTARNIYEYISVDICIKWKQEMNPHNISLISSELGFITCFPIPVEYDHINENNIFFINEEISRNVKMRINQSAHLKRTKYYATNPLKVNTTKYYETYESEKEASNFASCEYDDDDGEEEEEEENQHKGKIKETETETEKGKGKEKENEDKGTEKQKETNRYLNKTSTTKFHGTYEEIEKAKEKYKMEQSREDNNTCNEKEETLLKYSSSLSNPTSEQNYAVHTYTEEQKEINSTKEKMDVEAAEEKGNAKDEAVEENTETTVEETEEYNPNEAYRQNIRRNYSEPTDHLHNFKGILSMSKEISTNMWKSMTIEKQNKVKEQNTIDKNEREPTEEKRDKTEEEIEETKINKQERGKRNNKVMSAEQQQKQEKQTESEEENRSENESKNYTRVYNIPSKNGTTKFKGKNEREQENVKNENIDSAFKLISNETEEEEKEKVDDTETETKTEECAPLSSNDTQNSYEPISKNIDRKSDVNKSIVYTINKSIGCNTAWEKNIEDDNMVDNQSNIFIECDKNSTHSFNENFVDALSNISTEERYNEFISKNTIDGCNWHLTICRKVKMGNGLVANLKKNTKRDKHRIAETKLKTRTEKGGKTSEENIQEDYLQRDRFIMENEYKYLHVMRLIKNIFPNSEVYYLYNLRINIHEDRICKKYFNNCMILAGESNCFYNPIFHLSTNLEIQDVYNIGWKLKYLIHQKASLLLLETYEKERKHISETVLQWNEKQLQFLLRTSPFPASFLSCCVSAFSNISNITSPFEEFYIKAFMLQDEENYLSNSFDFTNPINTSAFCTLTQPRNTHLKTAVLCKIRARNCVLKYIHSNSKYKEKTVSLYDFLRDNSSAHTLILCINTSPEKSICGTTDDTPGETNQENYKNIVHRNFNGATLGNFFNSTNNTFSIKTNHKRSSYDIKSFERLSKIGRLANGIMKKNTPFCSPLKIIWIICDGDRKLANMNNNKSFGDEYTSSPYCPFYSNINYFKLPEELLTKIKNSKAFHSIILYDFISDFQKQFRVKLNPPNNFFEQKNFKSAAYIFIRPDLSVSHFNYVNSESDITSFLDYLYRLYT